VIIVNWAVRVFLIQINPECLAEEIDLHQGRGYAGYE